MQDTYTSTDASTCAGLDSANSYLSDNCKLSWIPRYGCILCRKWSNIAYMTVEHFLKVFEYLYGKRVYICMLYGLPYRRHGQLVARYAKTSCFQCSNVCRVSLCLILAEKTERKGYNAVQVIINIHWKLS